MCCLSSTPCPSGARCKATCMENRKRFQCELPGGQVIVDDQPKARNCAFYASNKANGLRLIYGPDNIPYQTFCIIGDEYSSTLAMSYSLENQPHFVNQPLTKDYPVSQDSHNWEKFRLSLARMAALRDTALKWKLTCSYNLPRMPSYDVVRFMLKDLDPLAWDSGIKCATADKVNIKGVGCANCVIAITQGSNSWHLSEHHASSCTSKGGVQLLSRVTCDFFSSPNYFGNYQSACVDTGFSCTSSANATTQFWFVHKN